MHAEEEEKEEKSLGSSDQKMSMYPHLWLILPTWVPGLYRRQICVCERGVGEWVCARMCILFFFVRNQCL